MRLQRRLDRITAAAVARPRVTLLVALILAATGGILSLGLRPSADTGTFVSQSSSSYQATAEDARRFGSDAVVILIREPVTNLVETKDLGIVTQLEACLGGQVVKPDPTLGAFVDGPASAEAYGGRSSPCGHLRATHPAKVVYGPGTFLNRAVEAVGQQMQALLSTQRQTVAIRQQQAYQLAIGEGLSKARALQAANAAGQIASSQSTQALAKLYLNSGISGMPRIDDPQFIPQIVFDQTRGVNVPKARFSYLFPNAESALIQVRLRASLSPQQQSQAIGWIRQAVAMPGFRLTFHGTYTVSGEPVVVEDLAGRISGSIAGLLAVAVLVMALVLPLVFRRRLRLLPLLVALIATGITFGLMALIGASLTLASIAVLPVLIGLAVDYCIQFQSRLSGSPPVAQGAATLLTAALATAAGFLMLVTSPVPMVQGFGVLLVVGVLVALGCALTVVPAAVALQIAPLAASVRGASEILAPIVSRRPQMHSFGGGPARAAGQILSAVLARPGRVLAAGLALAALGWVADTQAPVQTDVTKLVPSGMPALRNLRTLEQITGVSGEIDVLVRGTDVTSPSTIAWMTHYQSSLLAHYGYLETKGCGASTLCPALSLPDLFSGGGAPQAAPTREQINALLSAVPTYFSQAVITPNRQEATLAFGIRLLPLAKQQRVIEYMRSQLHPPVGVSASLTGLPVLAAQADAALSSAGHRLLLNLLSLLAVALVLLAILRDRRRALVPLVPIFLASGWSSLVLLASGIPLNPMSASLGTLVIAISTEFSVMLSERYREERLAGAGPSEALAITLGSTGRAVLASGLTAVAGFAVLVTSDITMLRDFGAVTVIDLAVSLVGVLGVLPAVLIVAENVQLRGSRPRWVGRQILSGRAA